MTTDDQAPQEGQAGPEMSAERPFLSALLLVEVHGEATHHWAEARLPEANRATAAALVARHIASERCGGALRYFDAWLNRHAGGPAHDPALRECLVAFLGSESIGTPEEPASDQHLEGFVAEHVWHLLTLENALAYGIPVRVDGPDWSVTDSGGDGLVVYRLGGSLVFRLWESKAHTGGNSVRDVVNGACRQVSSKALRYLARFSKVGQSLADAELRDFYGRLPEMWRHAAREAGGGISVATAADVIGDCFGNYSSYWEFAHDDQRQGLVVAIEDYAGFARMVQEELWKGL